MSGQEAVNLSFEAALALLEDITQSLEAGEMTLDETLEAYRKGMELMEHCTGLLDQAQGEINEISFAKQEDKKPFDELA